jgi:heptosyltransferase-3
LNEKSLFERRGFFYKLLCHIFRMKKMSINQDIPLNDIKSVLISRLRFMGDVILTTPLVRAIKENRPDIHITYLAESPYHSLLENHPDVNTILSYDPKSYISQIQLLRQMKKIQFDLSIDLFGNPRSAWLSYLSGARYRIGGDFRGRKLFYTHRIKDERKSKSAIQFHMQYLKPLGIIEAMSDPIIYLTEQEIHWGEAYLRKQGYDPNKRVIGIHPGASWPAKRWLPERFGELGKRLIEKYRAQLFFTMGPGEDELAASVIQNCGCQVNTPELLSIRQLASVLRHLDLYISNDCGPMHLAPAVGTKTIGIFGPGEPEIWFPYPKEKGHRVVHKEIDCSRCHRDFCDEMKCIKAITVDDVMQAVSDVLLM